MPFIKTELVPIQTTDCRTELLLINVDLNCIKFPPEACFFFSNRREEDRKYQQSGKR